MDYRKPIKKPLEVYRLIMAKTSRRSRSSSLVHVQGIFTPYFSNEVKGNPQEQCENVLDAVIPSSNMSEAVDQR